MGEDAQTGLRVALIAEADGLRGSLRRLLEAHGLHVVFDQALRDWTVEHIGGADLDVLLVDLDEAAEQDLARLDELIDAAPAPILFHMTEGVLDRETGARLIGKLRRLAETRLGDAPARGEADAGALLASGPPPERPAPRPNLRVIRSDEPADEPAPPASAPVPAPPAVAVAPNPAPGPQPARYLWVLAGSLGAPQAIRRFLAQIPADIEAGFLIVQHIAPEHLPLLVRQLERVSAVPVRAAASGVVLAPRHAVVLSTGQRFNVTEDGVLELLPERRQGRFPGSIDGALETVARCYADRAGTIVFSGMGGDGVKGVGRIAGRGGQVWVQAADSCVMGSMPEAARRAAPAGFTGSPETLARHLVEHLRGDTRGRVPSV